MTETRLDDGIPDNLDLSSFMSMDKGDVAELFLTASNPIYLESSEGPMMFALDCAMIIFNLGQGEKLEGRLSDVIFSGLVHNSPRIRAKSLYVASVLLHTAPDIIVKLVSNMTEIMIESRSALTFIERCFPKLSKKNKVHHDSFLSLVVLSLAERFEDKDLRETLQKILSDLLLLDNFNKASIKNSKHKISSEKKKRIKQASEFLFDITKPHLNSWVKLILHIPFVEMVIIKMISPIAIALLSAKGPRSFIRNIAIKQITSFLVKTYSYKSFPCNALEMVFFLAGESGSPSDISHELAELFRSPDLHMADEDRISMFSSYENGLIAWYLYTLIPYYFTRAGEQQDRTIALIKEINKRGGVVPQYIAVSSLWVITKYLLKGLPQEKIKEVNELYEQYCQEFFKNNGAWINFKHDLNTISNKREALDGVNEIIDTLNEAGTHGCKATNPKNTVILDYDNGILGKYGDYLGRNKRLTELTSIIKDAIKTSSRAEELLLYSINKFGDIGVHYPDDIIKGLKDLSHATEKDGEIAFKVSNREVLTSTFALTLAKIARIHPAKVFSKVKEFPDSWQDLLNFEISSALESTSMDISHAGESLYQQFLINYNARKTFAAGIEQSGTENNLKEFFGAFTKTVSDWIIKNPESILIK
ncbi:hypothetical protein ACFL6N_03400 [Thermodesulfobacteriota bacterium]